jgi:hypothetical protein
MVAYSGLELDPRGNEGIGTYYYVTLCIELKNGMKFIHHGPARQNSARGQ